MLASMLMLGFLLGLRHALEADHVAALAALATRATSRRELFRLAAGWGTGHSLTIVALGGGAILLGTSLPAGGEEFFDRIIGVVLVGMGLEVLRRAWMHRVDVHLHRHGDDTLHCHLHAHPPGENRHDHPHLVAGRAVAMGTLHGLAGSAPLLLLALPQSRSAAEAMAYLAVFGGGSIAGMLAFSVALSFPLRAAARSGAGMRRLEAVLGSATVMAGLRILAVG